MTDDIFQTLVEPLIRNGRYWLPDPETGVFKYWTRVSNFAKTIADSYTLNQWQQRMVAKGLSARPDLVKRAAGLDVKADRAAMNALVEQAKNAAGHKDASQSGTMIHEFAENLDAGLISLENVPSAHRPTLGAYQERMRTDGLLVLPSMQEQIICVPGLGVAGRFDKIVKEVDGTYAVGDVKSGKITYDQMEIEVQLALYAHGLNGAGVYDPSARVWLDPGFRVRTDYALVIHTPVGESTCSLLRVDIETGWKTAQLCAEVREERSHKKRFTPYEPPANPGWEARFAAVRSREEASALYKQAVQEFGAQSQKVADLVRTGLEALNKT